jgi:tetratricopeptide (TPR) repeat protein
VAEYESLLGAKPDDIELRLALTELLLDLGRLPYARSSNAQVLSRSPENVRALQAEARLLLAGRNYEEAVKVLERAIQNDPNAAGAHYLLGVAQQSLGLRDLATASMKRALALAPGMGAAATALSALELKSGDAERAGQMASYATQVSPGLSSAQLAAARAMIARGELKTGEALLEQVLAAQPDSLPALAALVNLNAAQNRTDALRRILALLEKQPGNAGLHFLAAAAYWNASDARNAEANVRKAIALDPRTTGAYTLLANINLRQGQTDEAKRNLERAIAVDPRKVANYILLAAQYEKEGNWKRATEMWEKARGRDSSSPVIAQKLAALYLDHGGDANVALGLAQFARQKMPDAAITADTLGWAYYRLNSIEAAIEHLQEAVRLAPGNGVFQYHLGAAYLARREFGSARRYLRGALNEGPQSFYAKNAREALGSIPD